MSDVTAGEVRHAAITAGITSIPHHDCAICGVWTRYFIHGERLFYSSSCGCASSSPQPRDWADAADWINMQSSPESRNKLRERFGLTPEEQKR